MTLLLALAILLAVGDIITFLAMGMQYEINPVVVSLGVLLALFLKVCMITLFTFVTLLYIRLDRYKIVAIGVPSVAFVAHGFAMMSNALVLTALEIVR